MWPSNKFSQFALAAHIVGVLALALSIGASCPGESLAAGQPNILFVFADDWGRYASAYAALDGPGSPSDVVRTPNFDRIAREGVLPNVLPT